MCVAGFRPGDRVPGVPARCHMSQESQFDVRLRRSGTTETSLVSNLVTDLVTGHTCKRPSPNGNGPLTCDDVGSGGTWQTCAHWFARRAYRHKTGLPGHLHPLYSIFDVHVAFEPDALDSG